LSTNVLLSLDFLRLVRLEELGLAGRQVCDSPSPAGIFDTNTQYLVSDGRSAYQIKADVRREGQGGGRRLTSVRRADLAPSPLLRNAC